MEECLRRSDGDEDAAAKLQLIAVKLVAASACSVAKKLSDLAAMAPAAALREARRRERRW